MSRDYRITPPNFGREFYPERERRAVWVLSTSIKRLSSLVEDFGAAVDLFEMSDLIGSRNFLNRQFARWKLIAARDGAMTLYHLGRILNQSGISFKDCPEFRKLVDHKALASARRQFADAFPHATRIRHSISHDAEMLETVANRDENAFTGHLDETGIGSGSVNGLNFQNSILGRRFTTTHEGQIISYEISTDTNDLIAVIVSEFYKGFDHLDLNPAQERRRFELKQT